MKVQPIASLVQTKYSDLLCSELILSPIQPSSGELFDGRVLNRSFRFGLNLGLEMTIFYSILETARNYSIRSVESNHYPDSPELDKHGKYISQKPIFHLIFTQTFKKKTIYNFFSM